MDGTRVNGHEAGKSNTKPNLHLFARSSHSDGSICIRWDIWYKWSESSSNGTCSLNKVSDNKSAYWLKYFSRLILEDTYGNESGGYIESILVYDHYLGQVNIDARPEFYHVLGISNIALI